MRSLIFRLVFVGAVILLGSSLLALDTMNYQGRLTDAAGVPVPNGNHSMVFRIFSSAEGGTPMWSEVRPSIATEDGMFSVNLGDAQEPLDLAGLGDSARYLEVQIAGDPLPLSPRLRLNTSPRAASAARLTGRVATDSNSVNVKRGDGETGVSFGSTLNKASMYIFAPQPEPPKLRVAIESESSNGGKIGLYDDAGEVAGIEVAPYRTGASIRLFAPQPEPPQALVDLFAEYGITDYSAFEMAGETSAGTSEAPAGDGSTSAGTAKMITMKAGNGAGTLRIGRAADSANSGSLIKAVGNATESRLEISGPPFLGGATQTIAMYANSGFARVGIGTPTPSQALQVVGNICYTGTIGACSDAKYKRNVRTLDRALDKVMKLRGVGYDWRLEDYPEMHFSADRQVGFVAQEVKAVLPEAVTQQSDGSYVVDYSRVAPLLLEAIKELRGMVEKQASEIRELKAELDAK